uniref:Uncharacterized protein n=1 Tax=Alexandrium andersonii TaxID=327968 RepID=A0A7S2GTK9_9DINO
MVPEAYLTPMDRFMMLFHPDWVPLHQRSTGNAEADREPEEEKGQVGRDEELEADDPEVIIDDDDGTGAEVAAYLIELEALEVTALQVARDLSAIVRNWNFFAEERSEAELEYSQASAEGQRLWERVARLRGILQRTKGVPMEAEPIPARVLPAPALGSEQTSLKLCKRARLLRQLPLMLHRAERFDRDEDDVGDIPLDELAVEAAALVAFRDEAALELKALEEEAHEMHRLRSAGSQENDQLERRIEHLKTCIASAKQKASTAAVSSGKVPHEEAQVGLAVLRQGGC